MAPHRNVNHSSRPQKRRDVACKICGNTLVSYRTNQRYCGGVCRRKNQRLTSYSGAETEFGGISTQNLGAAAELLVCADLLRKGLAVFKAMCPASAYDLVACNELHVWRLQVKKARRMTPTILDNKARVMYQFANYEIPPGTDVMALVVLKDPMEVLYFKPQKGATYYDQNQWRFWEAPCGETR